jgi:hypothetical protein
LLALPQAVCATFAAAREGSASTLARKKTLVLGVTPVAAGATFVVVKAMTPRFGLEIVRKAMGQNGIAALQKTNLY